MVSPRLVIFGEILLDCFQDGSVILGGAPLNVAWHLQAFGQNPLLISCIGDDTHGIRIHDTLTDWGMDLSGLQVTAEHPTGVVTVTLAQGEPHYHIVPDSAWDFIRADALPPSLPTNMLLYHGSLALRQPVSRQAWHYLNAQAQMRFVDLNLRAPWWEMAPITAWLAHAHWLKLNADELARLAPQLPDIEMQVQYCFATWPLQGLIVTQGKAGAQAFSASGERWQVQPAAATTVVDTVGAGDAFSSILLLGLCQGWPMMQTLTRAQQFASAVVGLRGATTRKRDFYQNFIEV